MKKETKQGKPMLGSFGEAMSVFKDLQADYEMVGNDPKVDSPAQKNVPSTQINPKKSSFSKPTEVKVAYQKVYEPVQEQGVFKVSFGK